jgi:hypothetical protein
MDFNSYDKHYIILTADRLIFNSKEDSIYLLSNKTIGLSARESIHFNVGPAGEGDPSKHEFIVNSPRIQLGLGDIESVAKGDTTVAFITETLNALSSFSSALRTAQGTGVGTIMLISINLASDKLNTEIARISKKYTGKDSPINSKISYTA